jgi:vacuolar-type H+-ATPase subunit C/Vma6
MKNTVYKDVFLEENDLETNIDTYLYNINKKIFKQEISSISYIYAYINLIDYENNDIINTIEGIRYNMEKTEIIKRLVR